MGGGPTRDEVKQQEHLAGMMGKEMAATLEEAGIERPERRKRSSGGQRLEQNSSHRGKGVV